MQLLIIVYYLLLYTQISAGLFMESLRDAAGFRVVRLLVKIMRVMRMVKILSR